MIDNLDRTDIAPGIYYPKPETTGTFPSAALGWRYGTYQVIERKTPSEDKYVVMTSSGSNQRAYRRLNDGVWSGWDINLLNADLKVTLKNNARLEIYSDVDTSYIDSFSGNTRRHRLVWSDGGLTLYKYSGNINTKIWSSY